MHDVFPAANADDRGIAAALAAGAGPADYFIDLHTGATASGSSCSTVLIVGGVPRSGTTR
jgi:hypothetical protein